MKIELILTLILLFLLVHIFYIKPYCDQIDIKILSSSVSGPTVLFIGSVHGNEPAGTIALENYFQQDIQIQRGKIIVITNPNRCGQKLNIRWQPQYFSFMDLNRSFEQDIKHNTTAKRISKYIKQSDIVIDLHEGWGYHRVHPSSMGSCVYPSDDLFDVGSKIVQNINQTISDPNKRFMVRKIPNIQKTTDEFAKTLKKSTIVLETTGQNNVQSLNIRVQQQQITIDTILKEFNMIQKSYLN